MNFVNNYKHGKILYSNNDIFVGKSIEKFGEYYEEKNNFVKKFIKSKSVILDIGAGIGTFTIPIAQYAGKDSVIFAFEPQRLTYYGLCGNIFLNNIYYVNCLNLFVGEETKHVSMGELDYNQPGNYSGYSLKINQNNINSIQTQHLMITIDSLNLPACDFIKIDTQGTEPSVINGAKETLNKYRPTLYINVSDNIDVLKTLLVEFNYKLYLHKSKLFNENNFMKFERNAFPGMFSEDIVCSINDIEDLERIY